MKTCWSPNSLPELRDLSPRARKALLRSIGQGRPFQLIIGTTFCVLLLGPIFSTPILLAWAGGWPIWVTIPTLALLMVPLAAVMYQALLSTARRNIRLRLARLAPDGRLQKCLDCGYDLRGTKENVCPECGTGIIISVVSPGNK